MSRETMDSGLSESRNSVVDIVKGIAIILVVLGHAVRGALEEHYYSGETLKFIDWMIYSFHMPVFFYLGGYFTHVSLSRHSGVRFIRDRCTGILWPYILWSLMYFIVSQFMINFTKINNPVDLESLLSIWWSPIHVLWFLYAFLILQILALVGARAPALALGVAVVADLAVSATHLQGHEEVYIAVVRHAPFFFIGYFFSARSRPVFPRISRLQVIFLTSLFLVGVVYGYNLHFDPAVQAATLPLGLLGISMIAGLSAIIAEKKSVLPNAFEALGRASMAIYLLHILVLAVVPRALRIMDADIALMRVIIGTFVGTVGSYIIYRVLAWARLAKPLGLR